MNKKDLSKLLIFLMTVTLVTGKSYGDTDAVQTYETAVQPTVAIEKQSSSQEGGSINPETGDHTGLRSDFLIQTNGNDDNYDFIVTSTIQANGRQYSAYGNNGCILFANIDNEPTEAAIENAKVAGTSNANVIAYPVLTAITSPMNVTYMSGYGTYGDCYVIKVNNTAEGTFSHTVKTSPVPNTFSQTLDTAGVYKTTVTFTAISK